MKYCAYLTNICAFLISMGTWADAPPGLTITFAPSAVPAPKDPEKPEEPAVKLPSDVRSQVTLNVKNESHKELGFYAKIKAAEGQSAATIQPWEYLKVFRFLKQSATLATIHGAPGAKFEFEKSRLWTHTKNEDGTDDYEEIECVLAPSMAGKQASKSITFRVRQEPGETLLSCQILYDVD